jgi:hypothetical protein
MSKETASALQKAQDAEAEQRAAVDDVMHETLAAVADGLPAKLVEYAKTLSHAHPDVAKQLGRDGIGTVRGELCGIATDIGNELRGAAHQIKWPRNKYVSKDDIGSALFSFLYGQRIDRLTALLRSHGFSDRYCAAPGAL